MPPRVLASGPKSYGGNHSIRKWSRAGVGVKFELEEVLKRCNFHFMLKITFSLSAALSSTNS